MKSKKAMYFSIFLVLLFIAFATFTFVVLEKKYTKLSKNKAIGERQMDLLQSYAKGEKAMYYIDRAAEISAEEAAISLANGGSSSCGSYGGEEDVSYAIWARPGQECYPSAIHNNYATLFNPHIASYLYQYKEENTRLPSSFTLSLSDSLDIIGASNQDLIIGIGEESIFEEQEGFTGQCGIDIVTEAKKYMGLPYDFDHSQGGYRQEDISNNPHPSALDCSRMTWRAYAPFIEKYGFDISSSYCNSRQQAGTPGFTEKGWGRVVDGDPDRIRYSCPVTGIKPNIDNLQPGDLVFFACTVQRLAEVRNKVSHVGIYAGDNKMVHCGTAGCREVDFLEYAEIEKYVGARRVCPVISASSSAKQIGTIGSGVYETEVYLMEGVSPGPVITIVAAMHGNEKATYLAAENFMKKSISKGTVFIIPKANKPAVAQGKRDIWEDLNRAFISENLEAQNPSDFQKLVQGLYSYMSRSDYVINLHEYSGGYYIDHQTDGKDIAGRTVQATKGYEIAKNVADSLNIFISENKYTNPTKKWLPFKQPTGTSTASYVEDNTAKTQHFFVESCCYSNPQTNLNERVKEQEASINSLLNEFGIGVIVPSAGKTIVLDPGHGTKNSLEGASGEAKIVMDVSLKLKSLLESKGYTVILTHTKTDGSEDLGATSEEDNINRAEIANKNNAALYFRVHADAANGRSAIYYPEVHPNRELVANSKKASEAIWSKTLPTIKTIGVKYSEFVLTDASIDIGASQGGLLTGSKASKVPTVLIELVPLNSKGTAWISNEQNQQKIAQAIAEGIDAQIKNG